MVNHFWQSFDAILEDVSVTETTVWCSTINSKTIIFQCSKSHGSPIRSQTRVTRLKVAPNMVDPISLKRDRNRKSIKYFYSLSKSEEKKKWLKKDKTIIFDNNRVCHVWCNFWPGYTCRTTVIFGTLKDGSLEINSLALNNCFSYRNVFKNSAKALSKMVLKTRFLSKSSKFRMISTIRFCSNFTSMWYKHSLRNVWRDFKVLMSALATVAGKSFNGKLTAKIDFPIGYFMLPLLVLTLKV